MIKREKYLRQLIDSKKKIKTENPSEKQMKWIFMQEKV